MVKTTTKIKVKTTAFIYGCYNPKIGLFEFLVKQPINVGSFLFCLRYKLTHKFMLQIISDSALYNVHLAITYKITIL